MVLRMLNVYFTNRTTTRHFVLSDEMGVHKIHLFY